MYSTSENWKNKIYGNVQIKINVYIDNQLINSRNILSLKKGGELFDGTFSLGSTMAQYIEMQLYKNDIPTTMSQIKIDYGILIDDDYEIIPLGIFNVEDYTDNDDNTVTIKATDNMIKFESQYLLSELLEGKDSVTILEIVQDICTKNGVELGSTSFLNADKQTALYDDTITAREYLSYIAELAGSYAYISRDGKLYFRKFGTDSSIINFSLFGSYTWGEQYKITKVYSSLLDIGIGDDTGNTIYINQDNLYVTSEEDLQSIYNQVKDLTIYSFTGKSVIDPAIDMGDILIIDGKNVIFQGEMNLQTRFIAEINSKIQIKEEETVTETINSGTSKIRILRKIDNITGELKQEVSKKVGNDEIISRINQSPEKVQIEADKISLEGKEINLTSDNITIESNNFSVDEEGKVTATAGEIGGFDIGKTKFTANLTLKYNYDESDLTRIQQIIMGKIDPTDEDYEKYDLIQRGQIKSLEYILVRKIINNELAKNVTFILNTEDAEKALQIVDSEDSSKKTISLGTFGAFVTRLVVEKNAWFGAQVSVIDNDDNTIASISPENDGSFFAEYTDLGFVHQHPTTDTEVGFGVGSGGYNRGIYDKTANHWMVASDKANSTFISANGHNVYLRPNGFSSSTGQAYVDTSGVIHCTNITTSDTTWTTATLTSSFKAYNNVSGNTPQYRKVGDIVEIHGIVSPTTTISAGDSATIFTLPEGYRPTGISRYSIQQGSYQNKWVLGISTKGEVVLQRYGGTSTEEANTTTWLPFSFTFII